MMVKGWKGESRRHSLARRGVKTKVDLKRYGGKWYEHSRYDNWFQKDCLQSTAKYRLLKDDKVEVINTCKTKDGVKKIEGDAVVQSDDTLGVKFFLLAPRSPYKVEYVDKDYNYAVVGHPDKKNLWILSRNKTIGDKKLKELKMVAKNKGYSLSKLKDLK